MTEKPEDVKTTWDMLYRWRHNHGWALPITDVSKYESPEMLELAVRQKAAYDELDAIDNIIKKNCSKHAWAVAETSNGLWYVFDLKSRVGDDCLYLRSDGTISDKMVDQPINVESFESRAFVDLYFHTEQAAIDAIAAYNYCFGD